MVKMFFDKENIPRNIWLWIFTSFFIQVLWLLLKVENDDLNICSPYIIRGDALEYLELVKNLIYNGTYSSNGIYANRMPGLALLLCPLLYLLPFKIAITLFTVIQVFLLSISTVFLSRIGEYFSKERLTFIIVFVVSNLSTHFNAYTNFIITETLAIFTLISMIFFLIKSFEKQKVKFLILSGLMAAWLVFLRPFAVPFVITFFVVIIIMHSLKNAIYYLLPLLLVISLWTLRNYRLSNDIIILQTSGSYLSEETPLVANINFVQSFGGSHVWWDNNTAGTWMMPQPFLDSLNTSRPSDGIFPNEIFTNKLTLDTLKKARESFLISEDVTLDEVTREKHRFNSIRIMNNFRLNQQHNNPFSFYIQSRIRLFVQFIDQPLGYSFRSLKYPFNVAFTGVNSFVNYFIILFGLYGIAYSFFGGIKSIRNNLILYGTLFIPLFIFTLFPIYFRVSEGRFIALAIPILICFSSVELTKLIKGKGKHVLVFVFILFLTLAIYSIRTNINFG